MNKKALILGNGPCAYAAAKNLLDTDANIVITTGDETCNFDRSIDSGAVKIFTKTRLISCKGSIGNFRVEAIQNHEPITIDAGRIIIAEEDQRISNFSLYGLKASSNVITLSRLKNLLNDSSHEKSVLSKIKKMVFLTGILKESTPIIAEEIMQSSLKLQTEFNIQTYILTNNLKVAGDGLETLYRETKNTGTVYIKFTNSSPDIQQREEKDIQIEFIDEVTSKPFRLTPDITVVDETIAPSQYVAHLAKIFKIEVDINGFIQADNVHRHIVSTNRKGIVVAGPSRSIQNYGSQIIDAKNAALALEKLTIGQPDTTEEKAVIHSGQCVRCLTCYRLCPYHAIMLNTRVAVSPEACERCGICAAQCPRGAVRILDLEPDAISNQIKTSDVAQAKQTFTPLLVAFCCSRSAAQARDLAICMGCQLPKGLKMVEVPCSGAISYKHIFTAFDNNADGVMVLTCHKGNCHSEQGNVYAAQTIEQVYEIFSSTGFEKERILIQTLASNMGMEFAQIANSFEESIVKLGPSRLKK